MKKSKGNEVGRFFGNLWVLFMITTWAVALALLSVWVVKLIINLII